VTIAFVNQYGATTMAAASLLHERLRT